MRPPRRLSRPQAVVLVLTASLAAAAPGNARTALQGFGIWDGAYTSEQAVRGKTAYGAACGRCHGEDLQGRNGRGLVGSRFWQDWGEDSLNSLFAVTRATMPREEPGSLSEAVYLDIVAYILQENGYPPGRDALTAERAERTRVVRREGPGPVPNFALVTVVGCLEERERGVWLLTNSSEPVRTRNPDASRDTERERSEATLAGKQTFGLMDVYSAGAGHAGHRMEIKGLLIRGTTDRVNLTSMQMLAATCP